GEVPGADDPDDAERLLDGDVPAAGHRDLLAEEAFGAAGRVQQQIAGVAGLWDLQPGEFLEVRVDGVGEAAQQPGPVGGREGGPAVLRTYGPYDGGGH